MTKNHYKLGIVSIIGIMLLNIVFGLYSFFQFEPSPLTSYLVSFSMLIFQLNIWILIRKIFVFKYDVTDLNSIFLWIIRLTAFIGALNILGISYKNKLFSGLIILLGLVNFILIVIVATKIWRIQDFEIKTINIIKNYILMMLIVAILSVLIRSIDDFRILLDRTIMEKLNIEFIEYLLKLIPLIILLRFIKKEMNTASA